MDTAERVLSSALLDLVADFLTFRENCKHLRRVCSSTRLSGNKNSWLDVPGCDKQLAGHQLRRVRRLDWRSNQEPSLLPAFSKLEILHLHLYGSIKDLDLDLSSISTLAQFCFQLGDGIRISRMTLPASLELFEFWGSNQQVEDCAFDGHLSQFRLGHNPCSLSVLKALSGRVRVLHCVSTLASRAVAETLKHLLGVTRVLVSDSCCLYVRGLGEMQTKKVTIVKQGAVWRFTIESDSWVGGWDELEQRITETLEVLFVAEYINVLKLDIPDIQLDINHWAKLDNFV